MRWEQALGTARGRWRSPRAIPGVSCAGVRAAGNSCQIVDTTYPGLRDGSEFVAVARIDCQAAFFGGILGREKPE